MIDTRPSPIHGDGLFTSQDVERGSFIGVIPNKTRGFNHGCEPNVELRPRIVRKSDRMMVDFDPFALRDIKADEELLTNYYREEKIPTWFIEVCCCPVHKKV